MDIIRYIGFGLLCVGFLSATFFSVRHLENTPNPWLTIPWLWYGLAMVIGVVGVVIMRIAAKTTHQDDQQTAMEFAVMQESLKELSSHVRGLCEVSSPRPTEIVQCIDHQCAKPFADFADARHALVKRFGLQVYADVMTQFARAERSVNRAWSAAADGYVGEATSSLQLADEHLTSAHELIDLANKVP